MSTLEITVRRAHSGDFDAWEAYVLAHPRGTFFHLPGWGTVVERVMKHRRCDLLALRADEVVGVFPVLECRGLRGRRQFISMPYAVYGGPLGDDEQIERALFETLEQEAVELRAGRVELRTREPLALDLRSSDLYATFIKELPENVDDVLKGMPKKARAEARKARTRHGLELNEGVWYIEDLQRLFHRNKRSLGSPALPRRWFHGLRKQFGERLTVHLVRRENEPLAAVMSFLFNDTVYAYYSGTADDADRNYSASNFMYMALQEWSVARGFRYFDFGRSRKDAGAFKFKQHQGFEPQPLHYGFRLIRDTDLPSLNPSNPKTKVLRDTWSRLPLWLTRKLSTPASRYLP